MPKMPMVESCLVFEQLHLRPPINSVEESTEPHPELEEEQKHPVHALLNIKQVCALPVCTSSGCKELKRVCFLFLSHGSTRLLVVVLLSLLGNWNQSQMTL